MLLLLRNPLSGNNFISELEPSPDSIHYLNPLVSLLQGSGLMISYQGRRVATNVPPLYSLILFPIYFIFHEIRFFYITNVLLTIISTILFYKIITKLFVSNTVKSILFLAFVTNYIIYWYPQVAMAENLLIPLYLFSIWLLLQPLTILSVLLLSLLTMAFFATKYIAWILSLSLIAIFIIKVKSQKALLSRKYLFLSLFFSSLLLLLSIFAYIEYLNKGINIFNVVRINLEQLTKVSFSFQVPDTTGTYSKFYMAGNFIRYLAGIMGGPVTVLQKDFILLPIIIGMVSAAAIFINLFIGKNRLLSFYFFIAIIGTLYFISIFYIVDARYLFVFIPAFFIIFGIFLETIGKFLNIVYLGFVYLAIILAMLPLSIGQVTDEINLNFFQPEKAKNYEAIMVMNTYTNEFTKTAKPLIISTLSPYMVDFYSNHKYEMLPLSSSQYFIGSAEKTWGINLKQSLTDIYKDYLTVNRVVLVSAYQTEDKFWFRFDMENIKEKFNLYLASRGCGDNCNLYRLEIKQ